MNTRLDTLKSLAETDPYYRGYLAGLNDEHNIGRPDDRSAELAEANRLLQARLERMQAEGQRDGLYEKTSPFPTAAVYASLDALVSPREVRNAADLGAPRIG